MELESKEGGDKEVIGGGLGTPPSLRLLFSALQKQRCSAEDKQRRVPHQEGKQRGDIFDQLKGHVQMWLGLAAIALQSCLHAYIPTLPPQFAEPFWNYLSQSTLILQTKKEVLLSAAALKPCRL